ncbi:MAG: hypothetical protein ACJ8FY_05585 [Gemmataceae bacterium]
MSPDADSFWKNVAGKLRRKKGFCPPTPEEAEAAFNAAPSVPLSEERINSIVEAAKSEDEEDLTDEGEWQKELESAEERELQLFRKPGEGDEAAKKAEQELEDEMLNDDPEEDKA